MPTAKKGEFYSAKETAPSAAAAPAPAQRPVTGAREQAELFDHAVSEFHACHYAAALTLFERVAQGPAREMAHTAIQRAHICTQRLAHPELLLRTPDEHYDYAIALMNEHRLEQAEKHLHYAIAQAPRNDYLYYALALCRGLAGDLQTACLYLRKAIELNPKNRSAARNDPDFAELGQLAPLRDLLYP